MSCSMLAGMTSWRQNMGQFRILTNDSYRHAVSLFVFAVVKSKSGNLAIHFFVIEQKRYRLSI